MKPAFLLSIAAVALLASGCAVEDAALADEELGLSKTSVFSTPDPIVAENTAGAPGENELLGAYFDGSPPTISHDIEDFLPITIGENLCIECHDLPEMIGEELDAGDPTPMPASHYTDLRRSPNEVTDKVIGARFTCTLCHATQADVQPLVANTYRQ